MKQEQRILRVVTKIFAPLILLFGLYVQFHGDYGPGGGFQAGVIFATALILYALVFGLDAARDVLPMSWVRALLPAGVLLYGGTGVYSLLAGYNFLDYTAIDPSNPAHGQHLGILLVELGVGLTVAGTMLVLFYAFAGRGIGAGARS